MQRKSRIRRIVFLTEAADLKEGGEFSLVDVIRGIRQEYNILCVCKSAGPLAEMLKQCGAQLLFCDLKWSRKFRYFFSQKMRLVYLYFKLRRFSPELIYANSGRINPVAAQLAVRLNIPLITHVRDLFDQVKKDKFLFGKSTRVITCSHIVAGLIKQHNPNVEVIYNGVDPEKFSPQEKSREGNFRKRMNLDQAFLVGNVGTIAYRKGFFEFVEVAKLVSRTTPEVKFVIIGQTLPGRQYILEELKQKIKQYSLEDKFIFTGFVKDIETVIADLDILLFPPRYEAFGRVIIEALACGVPVISTFSGGPEEIIENEKHGLLFKVGDINGMAEALIKLYQDKDLYARLSRDGHTRFLEKFTIEQTVKRISLVIDRTLER